MVHGGMMETSTHFTTALLHPRAAFALTLLFSILSVICSEVDGAGGREGAAHDENGGAGHALPHPDPEHVVHRVRDLQADVGVRVLPPGRSAACRQLLLAMAWCWMRFAWRWRRRQRGAGGDGDMLIV